MDHPISDTYLDKQTVRASAALPAAGAFDSTPLSLRCPGFERALLECAYTRGAVGGKVKVKIEGSTDSSGDTWYSLSQYSEATLAAGSDSISGIQRETLEYGATGAAIEKFIISVQLDKMIERLRVTAAESGVVGTPGTLAIVSSFS